MKVMMEGAGPHWLSHRNHFAANGGRLTSGHLWGPAGTQEGSRV
jgi:hypothetical protein